MECTLVVLNVYVFLPYELQVQINALNDSKLIGISVYNVVILCTIGGTISLIIDDPSMLYIFTASIVLFCTTLTLLTIFGPKVRLSTLEIIFYKCSLVDTSNQKGRCKTNNTMSGILDRYLIL